jgi:hypothetical protein
MPPVIDTLWYDGYTRPVLKRLVHLLLCGMALVQLGAVPPCLLDESAAAVLAEADGAAVQSAHKHSGPRIWHDEDEGDPRFAGIRASTIQPQTAAPAASRCAIPFLALSVDSPRLIPAASLNRAARRLYDTGPPPDALAAMNLPLLI